MKESKAQIALILDRSGSMGSIVNEAVSGYNHFLQEQKAVPFEADLLVVMFNNISVHSYDGRLANAPAMTTAIYSPFGMTALLDAVATTIVHVGARLANMAAPERPGKVIVAIMTDGLENSSRMFTRERVAEMIKHQQEVYGWEFIFLGANMDVQAEVESLGIPQAQAASFAATGVGVQEGYQTMSRMAASSRTSVRKT